MKFDEMTLDEMIETKNDLDIAIQERKIKDRSLLKKEFINSDAGKDLKQRCLDIQKDFKEVCKVIRKKVKTKIEIDVEIDIEPSLDVDDLFNDLWHKSVGDVFETQQIGKLVNAKKYHPDFRYELQNQIDYSIGDACSEIIKTEPKVYELLEEFVTKYSEVCSVLTQVSQSHGVQAKDLLKGKK